MPVGSKDKDYGQAIKESYDPSLERLRVDALINDGTDALVINPDGSVNVNINDASGADILLGQKTMAESVPVVFPSDQVISATISSTIGVIESGTVDTAFNEVFTVATSILTTVTTYTAVQPTRVKIIEVTGTNIATYTIYVNGTPIHKKRTFFGNLDNNFQFSKGYAIVATDVVSVKVIHTNTDPGDFAAFILVLKD